MAWRAPIHPRAAAADNKGRRARSRCAGLTYLGLILMVAVIAIASVATLQLGAIAQRRAAEEELLAIGAEFREALISYANATPPGQPRSPPGLQALLKDPRFPTVRRHLRKLYVDPLTGADEWGAIPAVPGPGIMGVYSTASGKPVKVGNFDQQFQGFEGKTSYRDWQFVAPPEAIVPAGSGAAGAAPGTIRPGRAPPTAVKF